MQSTIHVDEGRFQIKADAMGVKVRRLLIDVVDDVADQIESRAREFAPRGQDHGDPRPRRPDLRLRDHPVDRENSTAGIVTGIAAFGGGQSVRGEGGRFVGASRDAQGRLVAFSRVSIPTRPRHAIWVHGGTGIFGPRRTPIVPRRSPMLVFYIRGRKWVKRSVRGQRPQPYLTDAYRFVNTTFVPLRMGQLRAQLAI